MRRKRSRCACHAPLASHAACQPARSQWLDEQGLRTHLERLELHALLERQLLGGLEPVRGLGLAVRGQRLDHEVIVIRLCRGVRSGGRLRRGPALGRRRFLVAVGLALLGAGRLL